ncbi:MAG TPA: hypothetical protein VGR95_12580, partial [Thermoanaerobaculia bacterium]|nr:hypothetical protein [Thermoanaerobaculia bacterium]
IRDVSGTPLGIDQPAGSRIQSYTIKVTYAPAASVQSITFARAGITAGLTPTFESVPTTSNSITLIDTFQESTNLIPFTSNAPAPGNQVAHLLVTLSSSATPGSSITLTLDSTTLTLTDQGGSAATKETVGNGKLTAINGAVNVPALTLTLSPPLVHVNVNTAATLTASINFAQSTPTSVSLSSSATPIATVTPSVTIPAGSLSANATVSGKAVGGATITGSLAAGATATASVDVAAALPCPDIAVPSVTAPPTAQTGADYTISWAAVSGATDYFVDEASDSAFTSPTTQTVTATTVTFNHSSAGRYYYRVRAHSHIGSCDTTSASSTAVSVLVSVPVPPPLPFRVIAVVGSLPGNFGSYFRTSVQLYNPQTTAISGKIVFHTIGVTGSSSDPSLAYVLAPGKTLTYADLLPAMGVASGIGTADLVADVNSAFPSALVRVFNDGGAAGTTGLTEELMKTGDALVPGDLAVLIAPSDATKLRLNIGVRTLDAGATMQITVRDRDGNVVKTTSKAFDPTFFQQSSAADLTGYAFTGGESISIQITGGSAFLYGATTDNTSNDPSVQFAREIDS